ncbi:MAG: rRNA maturation RNase YbeY [Bacteroidota bacterium]
MISFFTEDVDYTLKDKLKIKRWIQQTVSSESKKTGDINIIFCSDEYLLEVNKQYLNHDYYTDIITFNYNTDKINGDLFISLDRVADNANQNNVPRETELLRVIIHGVLHLLGYNDKTAKEEREIRAKEDSCIKVYQEL